MENLPTPLSRVELYLAKACGMDVTVPEQPIGRLEQFLAILAGDTSITMPAPIGLTEQWLAYVLGVTPDPLLAVEGACLIGAQKVDVRYFAVAASMPGATLPEAPQNRAEMYWAHIAGNPPTPGILKYVTGKYFYLTDVVSGIEELQYVKGDTYQQTYSGKNIFSRGFIVSSQASSLVPYGDNGFTMTKPDSRALNFDFPSDLPAGSYTMSGNIIANTTTLNSTIQVRSASDVLAAKSISGTGEFEFKFTTTVAIHRLFFFISTNDTDGASITYDKLQVESGSSVSPFEPYVGGIPAPNPDYPQPIQVVTGEQTVKVAGKNLLPLTNQSFNISQLYYSVENGKLKMTGNRNPEVQRNSSQFKNNYAFTLPAGTYNVKSSEIGTKNGTINLYLLNKNDDVTVATIPKTGFQTFTLSQETELYLGIYSYQLTINDAVLYEISLEKGSEPTTYEPYQSQTLTVDLGSIELCKIGTYQDYIYNSNGDWYVHKETSNIDLYGKTITSTNYSNLFFYSISGYGALDLVCSHFTGIVDDRILANNTANSYLSEGQCAFRNGTKDRIYFKTTKFASASDMTVWLASNQMFLYYLLATPTDTKITDATLISQLDALNSATLPKPIANITVSATGTNLAPYLTIAYYGSDEE